jgi:4'-phosphopantetheinyl transferase
MPLEKQHVQDHIAWGWWRISETESELSRQINEFEPTPVTITNEKKRLEFQAVRVLLKHLLTQWKLEFKGIWKNEFGKPFLTDYPIQISLSHSYPYVAAIIHRYAFVGIDLEQPKTKLLNIAPRILHREELLDAGSDVFKHCIYWCAKETLIKVHGKKDLTFAENLIIDPFSMQKSGNLIGRIVATGIREAIPLEYHVFDNFVVVLNHTDHE